MSSRSRWRSSTRFAAASRRSRARERACARRWRRWWWRSRRSASRRRRSAGSPAASAAEIRNRPSLSGPLGELPKPLRLGELLQLLQRVVLDLPDSLARDAERPPDLLERQRLMPAKPVTQLDHLPLALRQRVEHLLDVLALKSLGGGVERLLGPIVRDEISELRLLLVPDRLLE